MQITRWLKDQRLRYAAIVAACIMPALLLLVLLKHYGVAVPFWDQWELVPFIQKLRDGHLTLADLWSQHNEHRILFPRLIMLALASLSRWNTVYETYINVLLGTVSVGLVISMLRRTFTGSRKLLVATAVLSSWILFSPLQWENWLWGWQIQWFLSIVGVVGTIWAVDKWPGRWSERWRLPAAAALAFIATYSLANGVLIWPIALVVMAFRRESRRSMGVWALAGVLSAASYYYHYVNPGYQPSKGLFLHHPKMFIHYVLVYLGHPLARNFRSAAIMGAAVIVLFVLSAGYLLALRRGNWLRSLSWLAVAAYAGAGAVSTAISRLGYGVEQAYSSRYTTVSNLFLVSTIVLLCLALQDYYRDHKSSRGVSIGALWIALVPLLTAQTVSYIQGGEIELALLATAAFSLIALLICYNLAIAWLPQQYRPKPLMSVNQAMVALFLSLTALVAMNYIIGIRELKQQSHHLTKVKHCVDTAQSAADSCLTLPYPNAQIVWDRMTYLKTIKWGGLR